VRHDRLAVIKQFVEILLLLQERHARSRTEKAMGDDLLLGESAKLFAMARCGCSLLVGRCPRNSAPGDFVSHHPKGPAPRRYHRHIAYGRFLDLLNKFSDTDDSRVSVGPSSPAVVVAFPCLGRERIISEWLLALSTDAQDVACMRPAVQPHSVYYCISKIIRMRFSTCMREQGSFASYFRRKTEG